jgi:hypothetical protein
MLFAAGRYADAVPLLERAAGEDGDPGAAAQALVAARLAGVGGSPAAAGPRDRLAARAASVTDDDSLFAVYGIRAAYLDALPFLSLPAAGLGSNGFQLSPQGTVGGAEAARDLVPLPSLWERHLQLGYLIWTADLMLDPGRYRVSVALRALPNRPPGGGLRAILTDASETVNLAERSVEIPPLASAGYTAAGFDLDVPPGVPAVRLFLRADQPPNLAIGGIEIRPDALANAKALAADVQTVVAGGDPRPAPRPAAGPLPR